MGNLKGLARSTDAGVIGVCLVPGWCTASCMAVGDIHITIAVACHSLALLQAGRNGSRAMAPLTVPAQGVIAILTVVSSCV